MAAFDISPWKDLFVASAGAAAALAGLVFVAVSINIDRILKYQGLPERALQSVLLLLSVVLVSIIGLIPGQSRIALGAELLGEALLFGAVIAMLVRRSLPPATKPFSWRLSGATASSASLGLWPWLRVLGADADASGLIDKEQRMRRCRFWAIASAPAVGVIVSLVTLDLILSKRSVMSRSAADVCWDAATEL